MFLQKCIANTQRQAHTNSHHGFLQLSDAFPIESAPVDMKGSNTVTATDALKDFEKDLNANRQGSLLQKALQDKGAPQTLTPKEKARILQMVMQCNGDKLLNSLDRTFIGDVCKNPPSTPTFTESITECLRKIHILDEELHMSTLKGRILLIELAAIYHSEVARIEMLRIRGMRKRGHKFWGILDSSRTEGHTGYYPGVGADFKRSRADFRSQTATNA
jgi:hypothetical protein